MENRALRVILLEDGETVHKAFFDRNFKEQVMRIRYFEDTDTTVVELSSRAPVETQELNENIYIDLDSEGRVVSLTIEHAGQSADMREFLYQRIPSDVSA